MGCSALSALAVMLQEWIRKSRAAWKIQPGFVYPLWYTEGRWGSTPTRGVFFVGGGGLGDGRNMTLLLFGFYLGSGSVGWVGGMWAISLKSQL